MSAIEEEVADETEIEGKASPEVFFDTKLDPVPLADPTGAVRAYVCAHCNQVKGPGYDLAYRVANAEDIERAREAAEANARQCCQCRRCKRPGRPWGGVCSACRAIMDAESAAAAADHHAKRQTWEEAVYKPALARAVDRNAALMLAGTMRCLSEDHYAAGWLCGLEYDLWSFVLSGPSTEPHWGMGTLSADDIEGLRALSEQCGGWWHWPSGTYHGEVFIPMEEWLAVYAAHEAQRADAKQQGKGATP